MTQRHSNCNHQYQVVSEEKQPGAPPSSAGSGAPTAATRSSTRSTARPRVIPYNGRTSLCRPAEPLQKRNHPFRTR